MRSTHQVRTIDPLELKKLVDAGCSIDLIDVRTPAEFREVHATVARNVPLDQIDAGSLIAGRDSEAEPLYFICRSDSRGKKACEALIAAGHENVVNVAGGTAAWDDLGLPVVRGKKAMSLERQVRIAAGSLVLVGALLGFFINPYWIGLSAFIGAGLVFAGVTDTCGMAMMLAKMPWNQVQNEACSAS